MSEVANRIEKYDWCTENKVFGPYSMVDIQLYPGYTGSAAPISLRPKSQGSVVSEIATRRTDLSPEHSGGEKIYSTYNYNS